MTFSTEIQGLVLYRLESQGLFFEIVVGEMLSKIYNMQDIQDNGGCRKSPGQTLRNGLRSADLQAAAHLLHGAECSRVEDSIVKHSTA